MPNPHSQLWRWEVAAMLGAPASDKPPSNPSANQLWWESDTGALFIWYVDVDSAQWVQVADGRPSLYDPFLFGTADMRLYSKIAGQVAWNNKADGSGLDVGWFSSVGDFSISGSFIAASATSILATTGAGTIYLRPNGAASSTGQTSIASSGALTCASFNTSGTHTVYQATGNIGQTTGGSVMVQQNSGQCFITYHISGVFAENIGINSAGNLYIGGWSFGANAYQQWSSRDFANPACDYRIKDDITPLPSMWEKVKALKPVSYHIKEFSLPRKPPPMIDGKPSKMAPGTKIEPNIYADRREHWGMIAHEVQEILLETAANGIKDDPDIIQTPTALPIITALTKALQEAMERIEALEALNGA